MSARIAVELTPTHLRAVVAASWRDAARRTLDVPWSPADPDAGVAALRAAVGSADSVAVAVGLGLLHVAAVSLPPANDEAREQMLALEGDRYFPLGERAVVAIAAGGAVAFAVAEESLEGWCRALEAWAPVVRVDAAPVALARALGPNTTGTFAVALEGDEHGVITIVRGQLTAARRIPAAVGERPGVALPTSNALPAHALAAWGALLGADDSANGTLASPARRRSFRTQRRRRIGVALVAAVAGVALAFASADRWRERTLMALQADVASRREAAAPGEAARAEQARLDAELALLTRLAAGRGGALGALTAISTALPDDAVLLSAHAVNGEWQVEGTAANAAALVPLLDRDGRFEQVRILSASSRFRDGDRTRETFSLALRVRARP